MTACLMMKTTSSPKRPLQNILVCRTDAIGDALLTLPVVLALKQAWPQARITFLASAYAAGILAGQDGVDEVWAYDASREGLGSLAARIRQGLFSAALLVFPDLKVSWAVRLAGVPVRVGTSRRWWSWLYSHRVALSRAQGSSHEAEYNLALAHALGAPARLQAPRLRTAVSSKNWARKYLQRQGFKANERLVVVHPGGRGSAANWPLERYRGLVERLVRLPKTRVLLTGSAGEQVLLERLAQGSRPAPWRLQETVTLPQLAALIASARVFVSGSTGPMHLAAGMRVPTVSFFPPGPVIGPGRWRPLGNRQVILLPPPKNNGWDMNDIPVEDALQAVKRLLARG
jgi:ADP-heptose:LPS heptosyltransferase